MSRYGSGGRCRVSSGVGVVWCGVCHISGCQQCLSFVLRCPLKWSRFPRCPGVSVVGCRCQCLSGLLVVGPCPCPRERRCLERVQGASVWVFSVGMGWGLSRSRVPRGVARRVQSRAFVCRCCFFSCLYRVYVLWEWVVREKSHIRRGR